MSKLEEDIRMAIEIAKCPYSNFDEMTEFSRIYKNTTENINFYMSFFDKNYKKALLPTASGDHHLEAILNGIDEITSFDLNRLAKYFAELKFGAIKNLTREEFIRFMYEDILNKNIFNFFKNSLDDDVSTFWEELYKNCNTKYICDDLFRNLEFTTTNHSIKGNDFYRYCANNFTSYLEKSNYKLVQEKLQSIKIEYIESDVLELHNLLEGKYDLINLTNIYEYINRYIVNGASKNFVDSVKKLIPYLNDDGKMLITYLYQCNLEDIKKYKNKGSLYLRLLCMFENSILGDCHDKIANKISQKTIIDKFYAVRNAHLLKFMKDLNITLQELEGTGLGCGCNSGNKDMILIYKKNSKNLQH